MLKAVWAALVLVQEFAIQVKPQFPS